MRKHLSIFGFLLLILNLNLAAQDQWDSTIPETWLLGRDNANDFKNVKGSPYLLENWGKAKIKFSDGKEHVGTYVNVNRYLNAVAVKGDMAAQEFVIDASNIAEIVFIDGGRRFVFYKQDDFTSSNVSETLYEVIYEGEEVTILKDVFTELVRAEKGGYALANDTDRFVKKDYYYLKSSSKFDQIKLNKASFKKVLSEDVFNKLDAYIKGNKLNWSEIDDIVKGLK